MPEARLVFAAGMALHAALGILLGIGTESEDQFIGGRRLGVVPMRRFLGVGVRLAWAVAYFAPGNGILLLGLNGGMPCFSKLEKLRFVTGSTSIRAHIVLCMLWDNVG